MLYKDKITKELISVLIKSAFSAREKSLGIMIRFIQDVMLKMHHILQEVVLRP